MDRLCDFLVCLEHEDIAVEAIGESKEGDREEIKKVILERRVAIASQNEQYY